MTKITALKEHEHSYYIIGSFVCHPICTVISPFIDIAAAIIESILGYDPPFFLGNIREFISVTDLLAVLEIMPAYRLDRKSVV